MESKRNNETGQEYSVGVMTGKMCTCETEMEYKDMTTSSNTGSPRLNGPTVVFEWPIMSAEGTILSSCFKSGRGWPKLSGRRLEMFFPTSCHQPPTILPIQCHGWPQPFPNEF
ncbi:hypothetical protein Fcan01_25664 [Folsomia candida]|uniref:Uncharacterized protein n=1 Tax=Folsomia candida TaxID=158441 RepID=A0A226D1K3_FOLCA|nr:hypothetical protein Fcan01_25664 [Folsomia candida]